MAVMFMGGVASSFLSGVVQFALTNYLPGSLCYLAAGLFAVAAAVSKKA